MTPGRVIGDGSDPARESDPPRNDGPDGQGPNVGEPVGGEVIEHSASVRAFPHPRAAERPGAFTTEELDPEEEPEPEVVSGEPVEGEDE